MRILLNYRQDFDRERPVASYAFAVHDALEKLNHEVTPIGEGHHHTIHTVRGRAYDLLLDLDNGRNKKGEFGFVCSDNPLNKIPTAVWFIDTHGQQDLHTRLAPKYNHVFFAVWNKRDVFKGHPSAHWCPNATEPDYFPLARPIPTFEFGFFGSKGGLPRATPMIEFAKANNWTYDVRQVNGPWKHKFPHTGEAMAQCRVLFNHGQKHDGPNLRVMESMAVGRPLITDVDMIDGMSKLFEEGKHYLGYKAYSFDGLEEQMKWALKDPGNAQMMADRAYDEVMAKHLVKHRVKQMLEVFNG